MIDFEGRIDGEPFEGGSAKDFPLRLGSKGMIPGFEEQLVGAVPGETREVAGDLPGRLRPAPRSPARTPCSPSPSRRSRRRCPSRIDDDWAKELGFEGSGRAQGHASRSASPTSIRASAATRLKRALLDQLAAGYRFAVPQGMVDLEFDAIWKQLQDEMERTGSTASPSRARARTSSRPSIATSPSGACGWA